MANEELYGGIDGAVGGASAGYQTGGPWGAALGGVVGAGLGAFSGHQKKKARKKAERRLREALQRLMAGSTDAYGNTLSADSSGRWNYNLSNAGRNAKLLAESALRDAATYQNKTPQQIADQNALMQALAEVNAKKVAQSAMAKSNLRTGSNMANSLANIARQSSQNLRNSILQGRNNAANSNLFNANIRSNLANTAANSVAPLNSMQSGLRGMVTGLNMPTFNASLGIANQVNQMNDPEQLINGGTVDSLNSLIQTFRKRNGQS